MRLLRRLIVTVAAISFVSCEAQVSTDEVTVVTTTTPVERVQEHNSLILSTLNTTSRGSFAQVVLAYANVFPLDERPVQELISQVGANSTNSDFGIVILVRILFLLDRGTTDSTNNTVIVNVWKAHYEALFLPPLQAERYWYSNEKGVKNDDTMNSENHMILWMSCSWLLQQRQGWNLNDATLRQRLVHYLKLKSDYGFYEFLSITYMPFTFGGLLNLIDYCVDPEIRDLADRAIRRLVADYLLFVNDKGIHFTVAGRDYAERFLEKPYTQPMDGIVYLLTGMGTLHPLGMEGYSCFLSTSNIDFSPQVAQWQSFTETTYTYGHTLVESFEINKDLDKYDRIVFQFSQGAYTHPKTVADTLEFIRRFGPLNNKSLKLDASLLPPPNAATPLAKLLKRLTYGTVWSGNSIRLYRQGGAMLSSVRNFWPGFVGGQTFPWMAVADTVPVWTQSGKVTESWLARDGGITNTHLPMVVQEDNVALIIYKPVSPMPLNLWGHVALNWPASSFDEVRTVNATVVDESSRIIGVGFVIETLMGLFSRTSDATGGSWILGRKGDSYIAVFRPCGEAKENGWFSCTGVFGRQLWAVVVGDAMRYGSFEGFASSVAGSVVEASYRRRFFRKPVYSTSLTTGSTSVLQDW